MGWLDYLEIGVFAVVLLVLLPLVWLFLRRRWLSTRGGLFDCGLRLSHKVRGGGWALGLARYEGNRLEWYRVFSFALRPQLILERSGTQLISRRDADQAEALVLFADQSVVTLRTRVNGDLTSHELAMAPESVQGLMSWLEAAPPGGPHYPGVD